MSLQDWLESEKNKAILSQVVRKPTLDLGDYRDSNREMVEDIYLDLKNEIHMEFISRNQNPEYDQAVLIAEISQLIEEFSTMPIPKADRNKIILDIINEIVGFGPITYLLDDPDVTEVMVNGPKQIFSERKGKLFLESIAFKDDDHIMRIIDKIVAPLGRRIDEGSPMVDARLPDGSRVNAIIPPLALKGPTLTIRKFSKDPYSVNDLIRFGTLSVQMKTFIDACVKSRLNIVISGGTGSGKTTTLGVVSSFIPENERIITIEDAAELQLQQIHVVPLETRPANIEGKGQITIRDLVKNALRMRPERIIVGEVRGGEALDMLQAMNTGHDGSLTTGHANSPRDMISRLETMCLMSGMELPLRAIREQISGAIDLIIQQSRLRDGSRKITHVTEVLRIEGEMVQLQDIFIFHQESVDDKGKIKGYFTPTGIRPNFVDKLEAQGIILPEDIFKPFRQ